MQNNKTLIHHKEATSYCMTENSQPKTFNGSNFRVLVSFGQNVQRRGANWDSEVMFAVSELLQFQII